MSFDLALNRSDGDLQFLTDVRPGYVSLFLIDGQDKIAQKIKISLQTFLGEWFLNLSYGVPYFEQILIKGPRVSTIDSILRANISAVEGVERVASISFEYIVKQRILIVNFEAITRFGPIQDSYRLSVIRRVT